MAPNVVLNGPVIAAGQSLSASLDVSANSVITRILMPAEWDSAVLTFQISQDGTNFYNVYDVNAQEFVLRVAPGSVVPLRNIVDNIAAIKFRSGRAEAPIMQEEERRFGLVAEGSGP